MKNTGGNKSHAAETSNSRQLSAHPIAMMAKVDAAKYDVAQYAMVALDDTPVDIDEMQIDKLYQSL